MKFDIGTSEIIQGLRKMRVV